MTRLEAIWKSAEKWLQIWQEKGEDFGEDNCVLCKKYKVPETPSVSEPCAKCPVAEYTGCSHCANTPYSAWAEYVDSRYVVFDDESKELAEKEYVFLVELALRQQISRNRTGKNNGRYSRPC